MGSEPSARERQLTRRPPPTLSERPGVSYAFLTPGVERLIIHFKSQAGTIDQSEKSFVPGFQNSNSTTTDVAADSWPYHLVLEEEPGGRIVGSGGQTFSGQKFKIALAADGPVKTSVTPRWIYVLAVDPYLKWTLLFPQMGEGNGKNHLPVEHSNPATRIELTPNGSSFEVAPPYGADQFLLLATTEPVRSPENLLSTHMQSQSRAGSLDEVLQVALIAASKGWTPQLPAGVTVERLVVNSSAKTEPFPGVQAGMDSTNSSPQIAPQVHGLIIGINNHSDRQRLPLPNAVADARLFAQSLSTVAPDRMSIFIDSYATVANVTNRLERIIQESNPGT